MQMLISLTAAGFATAAAEHIVTRGHFNVVAGAVVFGLAWLATAAALNAIDWRTLPHGEAT